MDTRKVKFLLNLFIESFFCRYGIVICFVFLFMHCYSGKAIQLESNTNSLETDKNSLVRIYEFGETSKSQVVILFSPVFWKDEILWDDKESLIPYLLYKDYKVYVISWKESNVDTKILFEKMQSILSNSTDSKIYFGGISIGGQKLAEVLSKYSSKEFPNLKKIFFLGTGFDYNYPKSFYEQSLHIKKESFVPRLFLDENLQKHATGNTTVKQISHNLHPSYLNKSKIAFGFFWGKIDSVSPEESIYPYYGKIQSQLPNQTSYNEFSIANGKSMDFDHGYLIRGVRARKEVYPRIIEWLESGKQ
jgi:hypothetical protein